MKQFFWGMLVGKNSNVGILMQTLYWYPPLQDRHFPEQSFLTLPLQSVWHFLLSHFFWCLKIRLGIWKASKTKTNLLDLWPLDLQTNRRGPKIGCCWRGPQTLWPCFSGGLPLFLCQIGHYFTHEFTQEFSYSFNNKKNMSSKNGFQHAVFSPRNKDWKEHLRNHHLLVGGFNPFEKY